MEDKYNNLLDNGTLELVSFQKGMKIIICKWVFKIKKLPTGSLEELKACLVAKGFHHTKGIYFSEAFINVVMHTTMHLVISLALFKGWEL